MDKKLPSNDEMTVAGDAHEQPEALRKFFTKKAEQPSEHGVCPCCGGETNALLFMGVQPDGYTCPKCNIWISPDGRSLAKVI